MRRELKGEKNDLNTLKTGTSDLIGTQINSESLLIFDNLVWLTSIEAAHYLRKSVGAVRVMVCRRQIRARKFRRRLYFKRSELDSLLESSEQKGGSNGNY